MSWGQSAPGTIFTGSFRFGIQIYNNGWEPVWSAKKFLRTVQFRVFQIGPIKSSIVNRWAVVGGVVDSGKGKGVNRGSAGKGVGVDGDAGNPLCGEWTVQSCSKTFPACLQA